MSVETILKERAEIFGESVEENIKRFDRLKAVDMKNFLKDVDIEKIKNASR